jgi:cytochrome c-type biogenesis protein CcmH
VRAIFLFALALVFATLPAFGKEAVSLGDPAVEARLKKVSEDLRCLVCQNQTLSDSNAELAEDLRNEIRVQIRQGKSDDEIRSYLVTRYGDFVLYKPPLKSTTALLWVGPFVLLAGGLAVAVVVLRRRGKRVPEQLDEEARKRIEEQLRADR